MQERSGPSHCESRLSDVPAFCCSGKFSLLDKNMRSLETFIRGEVFIGWTKFFKLSCFEFEAFYVGLICGLSIV